MCRRTAAFAGWVVLAAPFAYLTLDRGTAAAPFSMEKRGTTLLVNSIGMKLVLIPAGTFTMGSTKAEQDAAIADFKKYALQKKVPAKTVALFRGEGPPHKVEITRQFWLGAFEVTQGQFREVMKYNPSFHSTKAKGKASVDYVWEPGGGKNRIPAGDDTDDYPVENVSWAEAVDFCEKLSARRAEKGRKYRLPTEAEWEYACRGGDSSQPFHFGPSISSRQANIDGRHPFGNAEKGIRLVKTVKVGSYTVNRFGLYDMHGNVFEWCSDWYDKDYYSQSPRKDPRGPKGGIERVHRGGCYLYDGWTCRSAMRYMAEPNFVRDYVGFRVALETAR